MNQKLIPTPDQDVKWREVSDGVVLISPTQGQIRVLNDVGAHIWRLMDGKRDVASIEADLIRRYNTSPEQVRDDLHCFLTDLASRGLISWQ